jgi:hypothetical protein
MDVYWKFYVKLLAYKQRMEIGRKKLAAWIAAIYDGFYNDCVD